jgi:hypothetical protein
MQIVTASIQKIENLVLGGAMPSPRKYRLSVISPRVRRSIGTACNSLTNIKRKLQFAEDHNFALPTQLEGIAEETRRSLTTTDDIHSPQQAEELVSRMLEVQLSPINYDSPPYICNI